MKIIENGTVTAPQGFKGAGCHIGIKKKNKDFALIVSDVEAKAAGTFTTNVVKAAPVLWDRQIVENSDYVKAIAVNSGIANACTGQQGEAANEQFASIVAKALDVEKENVLICSTGVIGKQLSTAPIEAGIDQVVDMLSNSESAGIDVATSIMTTDTKPKHIAVEIEIDGKIVTIGACCKGSGMIHPNMATMLGFITTDINISKELLSKALKAVIPDTFNMISVDRDTSTNDTVLLLANGLAGNKEIVQEDQNYEIFKEALYYVNEYLAKCIAGDGEGATKLLEVNVYNSVDVAQAKVIAKSVCTSPLVKTAVYGNDANWGRLLCAMGYSGVTFDPYQVDLYIESEFGKIKLVENGMATDYSEEEATKVLSSEYVKANIDMKNGKAKATAWGCDLTYDYVKINADYRS
ncbi:bifunctional ornithine acetyltransferase/N-acetylglutamate synthase [[Clostridium] spiroforme]|nr:bifunctional ornithine acetyltransferase/N-acetylglutamate synthase [Thomasclavelia spiroformis]MBM6879916.1 bifunctional ornithine acetyltransferase/N-acetylglutamate synthase [Thomasclavelia spiroformis]